MDIEAQAETKSIDATRALSDLRARTSNQNSGSRPSRRRRRQRLRVLPAADCFPVGIKCLSSNLAMFESKPFDKLKANGFNPFVVSLSNHCGRLLDRLWVRAATKCG